MSIDTNTRTLSPLDVSKIADSIGIGTPDPNTIRRIVRGWWLYLNRQSEFINLNGTALIPSSQPGAYYIVTNEGCSCMDCQSRVILCKHKIALMINNAAAAAAEEI